jgi:drug/metabolite transporter (DMT)-like permease
MSVPAAASPHHSRGIMLMLVSAACFTANVLLIRAVGQMAAVDIWTLSCARFVVGLILVATFYGRVWQPRHLFTNPKLAERGFFGALGVAGYYLTVVHLGAGRATFINNTYLIWGALLAVWILGEHFRPALVTGSVAALGGLALLTGLFQAGHGLSFYDLVAVATAVASGYIVVTIRQLHATEHSSTIFSAQCAYGLVVCLVPAWFHFQMPGPGPIALILAASVCAGVGQLTMTRSFRDLSVAEGSLLQMLVPLGVALGDVVFFADRFTPAETAGAALILAGCALPALRRR